MNVPAVYRRSDRLLQRAFISASPVSSHDIVDHIEIRTDGRSPANKSKLSAVSCGELRSTRNNIVPHSLAYPQQATGNALAAGFTIRYKFLDNHPRNVKGTFIDIYI